MNIIINILYTGKNGNARKFVNEMERLGIADRIRQESGNIRYEYFFPMIDEESVLLIDEWESQTAIDDHHASPMMKEIADLREKYDLKMKVDRFERITQNPADEAFIRR